VVSVQGSPGTPNGFKTSNDGGDLDLKIGDPNRTISGAHSYTIVYQVEGALNGFGDHDELYWNAIGTEWSVPIESASVRVVLPGSIERVACFAGPLGSNLPCERSTFSGGTASFSQRERPPEE